MAIKSMALSRRIRAITYNVGLLRLFLNDLVPHVRSRSKLLPLALTQFIQNLKGDILFLQEVWNEPCAQELTHVLIENNFQVIRPRRPGLLGTGLLLAVRNSLEISTPTFHKFKASASLDRFASKGFIALKAMTPERIPFTILGTHLQSISTRNGQPVKKSEVIAHRQQAQQMNHFLSENDELSHLPAMMLGDFNVGPEYAEESFDYLKKVCSLSEVYRNCKNPVVENTWDTLNPLVSSGWNSPEPSALIDHCLIRDGKQVGWKIHSGQVAMKEQYEIASQTSPLSDHYALAVDLELLQPQFIQ